MLVGDLIYSDTFDGEQAIVGTDYTDDELVYTCGKDNQYAGHLDKDCGCVEDASSEERRGLDSIEKWMSENGWEYVKWGEDSKEVYAKSPCGMCEIKIFEDTERGGYSFGSAFTELFNRWADSGSGTLFKTAQEVINCMDGVGYIRFAARELVELALDEDFYVGNHDKIRLLINATKSWFDEEE